MATAIITGASRGIGAACARALADDGWNVGLTYAVDRDGTTDVADAIRQAGREAAVTQASAEDADSVRRAVEELTDALGPVEALVVNAGTTRDGLSLRMPAADWRAPLDVNLTGTANTVRAVAPDMCRRGGGSIVTLTSIVGVHGNAGQVNYAASKAGIIGLTRTLARELGPDGVRVNAVAPGYVRTRLTDVLPDDQRAALLERTSLGRLGEADDIAGPVAFLCARRSSFVTGTVLMVDGGLTL